MRTKCFIFVTTEGETYQPVVNDIVFLGFREIENLQVIGMSKGVDAEDAFNNLINEYTYIKKTTFSEVIAWQLANDYQEKQEYFYIQPEPESLE